MTTHEYRPGDPVPATGDYEELNVFGSWTGNVVQMAAGESFPAAPRGFTWRPLGEHSAAELCAHAAAFRRLAEESRTPEAAISLHRIADRLRALAIERSRQQPGSSD